MLISIDWLALAVHGKIAQIPLNFSVEDTGKHTQIFSEIYTLRYKGEEVATVQAKPFSDLLAKDLMIVKLDNKMLYGGDDPVTFIRFICTAWHWEINNINRIDICLDFQKIDTGSPQAFLSRIFSGEYHRKGDRKVVFHGRDKNLIDNIYTTKGNNKVAYFNKETNFLTSDITGYRAGSRASAVCVYMYNKTLELKSETDKPYIRALWRVNGLNTLEDVWRLEFSLKGKAFSQLDLDCFLSNNLVATFANIFREYFQIYSYDEANNPVQIVPFVFKNIAASSISLNKKERKKGGDKSDRLFLSRLCVELQRQHTTPAENNGACIDLLNLLIFEFASQKSLEDYAKQKLAYLRLYEAARYFVQNEK